MRETLTRAANQSGFGEQTEFGQRITSLPPSPSGAIDELFDELPEGTAPPEDKFFQKIAEEADLEWVDKKPLPQGEEANEVKAACRPALALRHRILPLGIEESPQGGRAIKIALYDPFDIHIRRAAGAQIDLPINWCMASRSKILKGLQDLYGVGADVFEEILSTRNFDEDELDLREETNVIDDDDDEEASVLKFVNQVLREALHQRTTDIHIEPQTERLRIRYRIDGVLQDTPVPERIEKLKDSVITRLKIMSGLDISEKRLPQDGRIALKLDNQEIDVRVACIPSVEGESISLRLLGQENFNLDKLDLSPDFRAKVDSLLEQPNGIILLTGPTGCGKSTSLYTFLSELNTPGRRIVTIEDPVENKLPGVVQIAVKPEIDLTFASGLRSILRGDPNIVMVGEIRDLETCEIAIRAALTGHLVFSTLHTNDSIGGITRLIDMGLEPFLVASSVRAFIAQRLVRRLCPDCRIPHRVTEPELKLLDRPGHDIVDVFTASPEGCDGCRNTGYRGRVAIYEICELTQPLQELVTDGARRRDIAEHARKDGFRSMREYGWEKIVEGITSVDEVVGATAVDA